ncbi:MAG: CcoQ/FixQ family Cbb3-type cytochrome c oxidase assembly chaperone [Spongiibacter sp.]|nr:MULTISPECIES: CcoQ/FixQ family Cbb3-type cytochrome c oxidase assembly chaperone [Spongiibacter]MBO6752456.1 CcoQ/FixQ family Cbb3-type cytochrome c oxidase assembly chaperone [Spongiibacter sp.]
MDQNDLRSLSTLMLFIAFIGVCISVYRGSRKEFYDEAANLPFVDDDADVKGKGRGDEQ